MKEHSQPLPDWTAERVTAKFARDWIPQYHYSGTVGTTNGSFWGVFDEKSNPQAVIGVGAPNNPHGVANRLGLSAFKGNYEITRVAAHPDAPRNTPTRGLALVARQVHDIFGFDWLFSYADTGQGHHGGIYQGLNAIYCGLNKPGGGGFLFVDGIGTHTRSANARWGTASVKELQAMGVDAQLVKRPPLHTYILPIGDKVSKRGIVKALESYTLPYPKRIETNDTTIS